MQEMNNKIFIILVVKEREKELKRKKS